MTSSLLSPGLKGLLGSLAPNGAVETTIMDIGRPLNGSEAETAARWLTGDELTQLNLYTFAKRRSEWLHGRICAKQAVINLLVSSVDGPPPGAHDFMILAGNTGRPSVQFLNSHDPGGLEVSISHSLGKAAGMAGTQWCGIDIQHLNETLFTVRERFCTDVETGILIEIPADELVQLGLLWVAKEAIRKCLSAIRLVGFKELRLVRVHEAEDCFLLRFHPAVAGVRLTEADHLDVVTRVADSFAIAACSLNRDKLDAGTA